MQLATHAGEDENAPGLARLDLDHTSLPRPRRSASLRREEAGWRDGVHLNRTSGNWSTDVRIEFVFPFADAPNRRS